MKLGDSLFIHVSAIWRAWGFATHVDVDELRRHRILRIVEEILERQQHQLVLFIPVGLAVGICVWFLGGHSYFWPLISACLLLLIASLLCLEGSYLRRITSLLACLLMVGFGLITLHAEIRGPDLLDAPWVGRIYGRVVAIENRKETKRQLIIVTTDGRQGLPDKIRLSRPLDVAAADKREIVPKDIIATKVRLMPPNSAALPNAYDFAGRIYFEGIGASGTILGRVRVINDDKTSQSGASLQQRLAAHVRRQMPNDGGAIAATLASGDRSGVSAQTAQNMRMSGMAHLLSISGLHVTAVTGAAFLIILRLLSLFPWLALRVNIPFLSALAAAGAAIFYTWLTGAQVPTLRACIAALLILGALAKGRDPVSMRLLAVGAFLVLLIKPESIIGPSFQLSFAAVAAIIALHDSAPMRALRKPMRASYMRKLVNGAIMLFLTGLIVEMTLAPIALHHFHRTGLYGALANMIAIPLTTLVIMPLISMALALDIFGLGAPIWQLADYALNLLLLLADKAANAPGAHNMLGWHTDTSFAFFCAGLILIFLLKGWPRFIGAPLILVGLAWMGLATPPDILIENSGRQILLRDKEGGLYISRDGGSSFLRDILAEAQGTSETFLAIEEYPGANCNPHACIIEVESASTEQKGGHDTFRIMLTRSNTLLDYTNMIEQCALADIIVSDRGLPKACKPRWLSANRYSLRQSGGLAIWLNPREIQAVADEQAHLPWSKLTSNYQESLITSN